MSYSFRGNYQFVVLFPQANCYQILCWSPSDNFVAVLLAMTAPTRQNCQLRPYFFTSLSKFWKLNIPVGAEGVNILHLADCQRE